MNKLLLGFLFSLTSIFAENTPSNIPQEKNIKNLQKYCSKHPDLWQGFYNLGRDYYQAADFKNAEENFSTALQKCPEPNLQESIFYNLGNTYFKQFSEASKEQQIPLLEKCIQNYESALALNPDAEDTKKNLEIAKKLLEQLKKEQQQQQNKKNNQDKNKSDKKNDKKDSSEQQNQQQNSNSDKKEDQQNQQQNQQNSSNSDKKDEQEEQQQNPSKPDNQNTQPKEQKTNPAGNADQQKAPQTPKQQEMENILQKEKNNERILPMNFSKNQNSPQDKVLKDW